MDTQRRILALGAAAMALLFWMYLTGSESAMQLLSSPKLGQAAVFLSTGRVVRQPETAASQPESTVTEPPATQPAAKPLHFTDAQSALVQVKNTTGLSFDLDSLLAQPLDWNLKTDTPAVLILHTHGSESYQNTENYQQSAPYRTLDTGCNMVSIGQRVGQLLEEAGIRVIHDQTLHDSPSYSDAYEHARHSLQAYLEQYPDICLVLDLHRDAAEDSDGNQVRYTLATDRGETAQLMLVIGTNDSGLEHPNWQENLALGVKLQACLETIAPGICRDLSLRTSRFNQDLCSGAVLVEVGSAGNTRQEALRAAEVLAQAVIALAEGAK